MTVIITGTTGLRDCVGRNLGRSTYESITQEQVDAFADVTGDHQWIHVDPVRAAAGPFGATIVHGLFTLSRAASLAAQVFRVDGIHAALNYGFDRIRFPAPLRVGTPVALTVDLLGCIEVDRGVQVTYRFTMSAEASKPACVADNLVRYFD